MTELAPEPPADLHARRLALRTLAAGTLLWRIHDLRREPVWYGPAPGAPPTHRFDAPDGEFHVCYLGLSPAASFAETFLRNPGYRLVDASTLATRSLTPLVTTRHLRVVRFHGPEAARIGATAEVAHARDYPLARRWSHALWSHPKAPDGILYRSRHDDDEVCLALFDRAGEVLSEAGPPRPLLYHSELPILLRRYRLGFDPSG